METHTKPLVLLVSDNVWQLDGPAIRAIAPHIEPVIYEGDQPLSDDVLERVDIAFLSSDVWPERIRGMSVSVMKAQNLSWMQTFSAGVDSPFFQTLIERGVRLTTASGATASPIAQTVMMYMLALGRDLRRWTHQQNNREWKQHSFVELDGSSLAVIGMGPIGEEIVRLGIAFNMSVEAIRRTPLGTELCPTFPMSELEAVLSRADWVAVALPLSPETRQIFSGKTFAAMRQGARFINVGRGELVDEQALIASLQSGHIAGAGLDVFEVEPLPTDNPLWAMDNVIVTPHNSGTTTSSGERTRKIFLENLQRFVSQQPLKNLVAG